MQRRSFLLAAAGVVSSACLRSLRTPTAWRSDGPTPPLSPLAANPTTGMWPQAVKAAPAKVQEAYKWAVLNQPTLQYIPCYCGCAGQGHKNNFDCYVSEAGEGGWVILSDHAFGWMTCVDITRDVIAGLGGSKSLKEIRAEVDAKYSGVGRGTPTMLP